MSHHVISTVAKVGETISPEQVRELLTKACSLSDYNGKRVLVIVPDSTRTAPVGLMFQTLYDQIGISASAFDVMIALGTHPPMSEEAICARLEISAEQRRDVYGRVRLFNHEWDNPKALKTIGTISSDEISDLTKGLFAMDVEVRVNKHLFDYDRIIIIGPVFPHEVVGCSGGNKYLFPGVSGPEVLNFFHWLGAVVTNPMIIGNKWTPVRKVVDRAAELVKVEKFCFCMVVQGSKVGGTLCRFTRRGLGRGLRALTQTSHHPQGQPVPYRALLCTGDV